MPWGIAFDADYTKKQWGLVTNLRAGVPQPLPTVDPGNLPIDQRINKPQIIMVQALPTNNGVLTVGPAKLPNGAATTLPADGSQGGFDLAAGEMMSLPSRAVADWVVVGSGDGGQALKVLYLAGGN